MEKTAQDANKSTQMLDQGRHHIGDFLPPEELSKFMNKYKVYLPIDCFQVLFKFLRCSHRKLDSCSNFTSNAIFTTELQTGLDDCGSNFQTYSADCAAVGHSS